jgi:pimeloyl-ACP methyl ester carboxylesterase
MQDSRLVSDPQFQPDAPAFVSRQKDGVRWRLAARRRAGAGPTVVWLGGFRSEMTATKATRLDGWAQAAGRAFLRFDYTGHGESQGRFEDGTIGLWSEDALAAIDALAAGERLLLVGSSMGGWIALLVARALAARGETERLAGLVLIAPAVDFTEALIWARMDEAARADLMATGRLLEPSDYSDEPTVITRALIEDGRANLLFPAPIRTHCPVHILQGMRDPDVPWRHAQTLFERLNADPATISYVREGDHRLSREEDLRLLIAAVETIA